MLLPNSASAIPPNSSEDSYKTLEWGRHPDFTKIYQQLLGEMITRGYPVLGGTGQMFGKEEGFNPVGFGQR